MMQQKHLRLQSKYLSDAETLLAKNKFIKASEKLWGAVVQIIKAVAAKRNVKIF